MNCINYQKIKIFYFLYFIYAWIGLLEVEFILCFILWSSYIIFIKFILYLYSNLFSKKILPPSFLSDTQKTKPFNSPLLWQNLQIQIWP